MTSNLAHRFPLVALGGAMLLGIAASATPAQAQMACGKRAQVVKMLESRNAETPVSVGLAANGAVVEVFATVDGTSWTILMSMPDGRTCLMAAGESWMSVTQVAGQLS